MKTERKRVRPCSGLGPRYCQTGGPEVLKLPEIVEPRNRDLPPVHRQALPASKSLLVALQNSRCQDLRVRHFHDRLQSIAAQSGPSSLFALSLCG